MAMELVTGQEVWIAFAAAASSGIGGPPVANVHRAVVIDGENRVLKRDNGYVGICQTWSVEQCFPTEAAAWSANADLLERFVVAVEQKAQECRRSAAQAAAKGAVEVAA
jgi:hypothetical protein